MTLRTILLSHVISDEVFQSNTVAIVRKSIVYEIIAIIVVAFTSDTGQHLAGEKKTKKCYKNSRTVGQGILDES